MAAAVEIDAGGGDRNYLTEYRISLEKAIDANSSNSERAAAARRAIELFNEGSRKKLLDSPSRANLALDEKSLALVEAAHAVGDERYRKEAIKIADTARRAQQILATLEQKRGDVYETHMEHMKVIAEEKGDLYRAMLLTKGKQPELPKLNAEIEEIYNKLETSKRTMQEDYAAFKGMTGVSVDYVEPATAGTNKTQ